MQYKTPYSYEIELLSFLKAAWRTTPRDYAYIDRLKRELERVRNKKKNQNRSGRRGTTRPKRG